MKLAHKLQTAVDTMFFPELANFNCCSSFILIKACSDKDDIYLDIQSH